MLSMKSNVMNITHHFFLGFCLLIVSIVGFSNVAHAYTFTRPCGGTDGVQGTCGYDWCVPEGNVLGIASFTTADDKWMLGPYTPYTYGGECWRCYNDPNAPPGASTCAFYAQDLECQSPRPGNPPTYNVYGSEGPAGNQLCQYSNGSPMPDTGGEYHSPVVGGMPMGWSWDCYGIAGGSGQRGCYALYSPGAPSTRPSVSLSANPLTVYDGDRTTLTWGSSNLGQSPQCYAYGPWSNSGTLSGSGLSNPLRITTNTVTGRGGNRTTYTTSSYDFSFLCINAYGVATPMETVTVNVVPRQTSPSCTSFVPPTP